MIKRYISFKKLGLPLLLTVLLLVLAVGPALSAQVTLLSDGFEKPITFDEWDGNGITDWKANPSLFHSGLRSARASNNSEGYLTSDDLDASDAVSIVVDFWFYKVATSDTGFTLYYYNGTSYDLITELDGWGGGADNTWIHYTQTITDPQYFRSDFRIQFDATLEGSQLAYLDDVLITKDTGEPLAVSKTGNGTVTSTPPGIDCGLACSKNYATNTVVTLSAVADPGWAFTGWSGDCTGTGPCQVTMNAARSVAAEFLPKYTLSVSKTGTGTGTVTSTPDGIDCGEICSADFDSETVVTLSAVASIGSTFTGWSGSGCSGTGDCLVTMDSAKSVTATFTQDEYTLTVVSPHGTVSKAPDQATYTYGTEVLLTMEAVDPGWTFTGWSGGGCTGTDSCTVTMTADTTVTANFTQDEYTLTINVVGNGSVAKNPNQATYHYGDVVQLTATPDFGWSFANWYGDLTSTTNPDSITMTGNKTVTALFVKFHLYFPVISQQP